MDHMMRFTYRYQTVGHILRRIQRTALTWIYGDVYVARYGSRSIPKYTHTALKRHMTSFYEVNCLATHLWSAPHGNSPTSW